MIQLKEALIGKKTINNAKVDNEYICVCLDPNFADNMNVIELLKKYYALELFSLRVQVFVMKRVDFIRLAKKYRWHTYVVLAPFDKDWSKEQIIKALKNDSKLSNFEFVTVQIEDEVHGFNR